MRPLDPALASLSPRSHHRTAPHLASRPRRHPAPAPSRLPCHRHITLTLTLTVSLSPLPCLTHHPHPQPTPSPTLAGGRSFPSRTNHHFAPQTFLCRTDLVPYDAAARMDAPPAAPATAAAAPATAAAAAAAAAAAEAPGEESEEVAAPEATNPLSEVLRALGLDQLPPAERESLLRLRLNRRPGSRRQHEPPSPAQRCRFRNLFAADLRALCEA